MPSFHEVLFPLSIAFGADGGPERRTEVVALASGREERNTPWAHSRRRWDAGVGVKSHDDLHTLISFFEARRGRLYGFRWRDAIDWRSCPPSQTPSSLDQPLGAGDGSQTDFQLIKRYESGAQVYDRPVKKPVSGSVTVALDGVDASEGADFTVDETTGVVTFAAPPGESVVVTAGYAFDTPVRFDTDRLDISQNAFGAGEAISVPVIELRL